MDIEFASVVQGEDVYSPLELAMTLQTDEESLIEDALADLLIEQGKIDRAGLERAQRVCEGQNEALHSLLPKLGLVSEPDMAAALADILDLSLVTREDLPDLPLFEDKLSTRVLREHCVLPLADTSDGLVLAMTDPLDSYAADAMRLLYGFTL